MASGQTEGLLADALHQAAVAGDDIGMVIDDLGAIAGALNLFGHCKADRVGKALTQRACGHFDARSVAIFGVACGDSTPLTEVAQLINRHVGIPGQMQQTVQQHRTVTRRQDKTIAILPVRGAGIKFEMVFEQHCGDIGHAHRHPGVTRVGRAHRIKRQSADGGGFLPMGGVSGPKRLNVQNTGIP